MHHRHFTRNTFAHGAALLAALLQAAPVNAAVLQCMHLPTLFDRYLRHHYSHKTMTDTLRQHTVEQYIKQVDPSKTMLLEEDVAKVRAQVASVFQTMGTGNCGGLELVSRHVLQRAKENEVFVRKFMGPDYKLDEKTEFMLDPEKRGYPKTQAEKDDVLRRMAHFQISSYLLSGVKIAEAKKQLVHRYELVVKRMNEKSAEDAMETLVKAYASALDPHSDFFSRDTYDDFRIGMELSLEGIGASLSSQDGFTVIEELIPGGSAEKAGRLQPKDKIIAVAQDGDKPANVIDMDLRDVVKLIRGKAGTKVSLTVLRQSEKTESFDLTLVRGKIDIKDSRAEISYEKRTVNGKPFTVGIINLPTFYGGGKPDSHSSSRDVRALLVEANAKKVDGIVLNLARNGGGLLDEAVKISGFFIARGSVVATKDTESRVQVLNDEDKDLVYAGPLLVLVSRLSASASEILAGVLRDYRRAVVVGGDHTFGKGSVQIVQPLEMDLGAMKVTTGMFFLPGGKSTQHSGVSADIELPFPFLTDDIGEGKLDYSLPSQSIPPFLSREAFPTTGPSWPVFPEDRLKRAAERSKERVAKNPKFIEIRKNLDEARKNAGMIRLSEVQKKSKEEKAKEDADAKKPKARKKKAKDVDQPLVEESVSILLDLVASR